MNCRTFLTREADLHAVVGHVEDCARALGLPRELVLRLCLIVEELFVNTARYGGEAEASVELLGDAAGVWLCYTDTAPAFDPIEALAREALSRTLEGRPIGGLGRILVHDLSTTARYERIGTRNVLKLRFDFDPAPS
ncbi:MAG TPA: ATP-binding protein [Gammaproteobacteria bacterium]|nr:ATP-binding protein [Gammaproteobacteria bacterium]